MNRFLCPTAYLNIGKLTILPIGKVNTENRQKYEFFAQKNLVKTKKTISYICLDQFPAQSISNKNKHFRKLVENKQKMLRME